MATKCSVCGITPIKIQQCSKCRAVLYCGSACQLKDWPSHKQKCVSISHQQTITTASFNKSYEPNNTSEYKLKSYWNSRFEQEEEFDWLGKVFSYHIHHKLSHSKYSDIKDSILKYMTDKSIRIMILGCGNSTLSDDLYQDGYHNVISMDYSDVVIEKMKKK